MTAKKFNEKAAELGCKARIDCKGRYKRIKFYEFRGNYEDNYETWFPINSIRFNFLINDYAELQNN